MKIIKWQNTAKQWKEVISVLSGGGVIVSPSESSYGLSADPTNKKAVDKIFKIKQRPKEKSLILAVSGFSQAKKYCKISKKEKELIRKKWPGPFTFILGRKSSADKIVFKVDNYAVRVSSNPVLRALARKFKRPVITTSANISGALPCYDVPCVIKQFGNAKHKPDLVIDCGTLPKRKMTRIIRIDEGKIVYLR